jgi:hypothetical protein
MGRLRQVINLTDEINQDIKQHSFAQLFLIRKDPEVAALNDIERWSLKMRS